MNAPRLALMTIAAGAGLAGVVLTHSGAATGVSLGAGTGSSTAGSGAGSATGHHLSSAGARSSSAPGADAKKPKHPSASAAGTGTASAARTVTGEGVNYGYGVLAVRVTASGSRITNVTVPTLQVAEQYSQQLAQQVIPMLKNEALHAQSAKIAAISGATYTSEAYAMSLQAALRKLHIG